MKDDILATPKGRTVKLADGKEYTLSPLNMNLLVNLEEAFDCDLDDIEAKMNEGRKATVFRKLLWLFLRDEYPNLSLTDVGKLLQLNQMTEIVKELTEVLEGLKV